jgi:hypothetical protein
MQPLPRQAEMLAQDRISAVEQITAARMSNCRHVHPDLVRPSGFEPDRQQRRSTVGVLGFVMGDAGSPARPRRRRTSSPTRGGGRSVRRWCRRWDRDGLAPGRSTASRRSAPCMRASRLCTCVHSWLPPWRPSFRRRGSARSPTVRWEKDGEERWTHDDVDPWTPRTGAQLLSARRAAEELPRKACWL